MAHDPAVPVKGKPKGGGPTDPGLSRLTTKQLIKMGRTDRLFLEGPQSRWREVLMLVRAMRDFLRGFRTLDPVGPCVTVFGSARFNEGHPHYELAR